MPLPQPPVLVAPDSFKGTLSAREVAAAIAEGIERAGLAADRCPVADGGEGTLDVLVPALGAVLVAADVHDPLGRPLRARFGFAASSATAIVESAAASGLGLLADGERDAWAASTAGTGELIAAAVRTGAEHVLVAVGGSASTDGGAGALAAIAAADGLGDARLTVLCDVQAPFEQAAVVFGPQKGADAAAVAALSARLGALAAGFARDPRGVPMTGCAGGLSGGLWAQLEATLVPGASWVLAALGFDARLGGARAVMTGEGRLDEQTLDGKLVGEVARRARDAGVPAFGVVGGDALGPAEHAALGLREVAEAGTLAELAGAGERLGRMLREEG